MLLEPRYGKCNVARNVRFTPSGHVVFWADGPSFLRSVSGPIAASSMRLRNILIVKMADLPPDSFALDRDGLVGHDLRPLPDCPGKHPSARSPTAAACHSRPPPQP